MSLHEVQQGSAVVEVYPLPGAFSGDGRQADMVLAGLGPLPLEALTQGILDHGRHRFSGFRGKFLHPSHEMVVDLYRRSHRGEF